MTGRRLLSNASTGTVLKAGLLRPLPNGRSSNPRFTPRTPLLNGVFHLFLTEIANLPIDGEARVRIIENKTNCDIRNAKQSTKVP